MAGSKSKKSPKRRGGPKPKPKNELGMSANSYYSAAAARMLAEIGHGSVSAGAKIVVEHVTKHRDNEIFREIFPMQNPTI